MSTEEAEPQWFTLFCARAPASEIAISWLEGLPAEEREKTKGDEGRARARAELRRQITDSERPEVRKDAKNGWKYTGSVLRAADAVLGIKPGKSRYPIAHDGSGAAGTTVSGPSERRKPWKLVLLGTGEPGTLGIFWSDFEAAINIAGLRERKITKRINVAIETIHKFPVDDGFEVKMTHVPMEDAFTDDPEVRGLWVKQLMEILATLRGWRDEGAIVNINCQMGKNRSGAAVLVWLCSEEGWKLDEAVEFLRDMNPLACANPHLVTALAEFLKVKAEVQLVPAADGGGWICISPPGSPRQGGLQEYEASAQEALDTLAAAAAAKLAGAAEEDSGEEEEQEEAAGDMEGMFDGI